MTTSFQQGDVVRHGNRVLEVSYWPQDDDGFAVLTQHFENKNSNVEFDNAAKLKNVLVLMERSVETASVLPAPLPEADAAAQISAGLQLPPQGEQPKGDVILTSEGAVPVPSPAEPVIVAELPAVEAGTATPVKRGPGRPRKEQSGE